MMPHAVTKFLILMFGLGRALFGQFNPAAGHLCTGRPTVRKLAAIAGRPRLLSQIPGQGRVLRVSLLFLFSVACWGATLRLYLTDGTYQWAREYQVLQDRVRYYSSERDEWEEIPLTMIDLHRTQMEASRSNAGLMSRAMELDKDSVADEELMAEMLGN